MKRRITRRRSLGVLATGITAALLDSSGCSSESQGPSQTLAFEESDEFYDRLKNAILTSRSVVVNFDGHHRIAEGSRFLKKFLAHSSNWSDLCEKMLADDTKDGRERLKLAFQDDLLEHSTLEKHKIPNRTTDVLKETPLRAPSGEVIEPTTVILVLGILMIIAGTSVAQAGTWLGRNYTVNMQANMSGIQFEFVGQ